MSSAAARLPFDDSELELEEVEGLLVSPSTRRNDDNNSVWRRADNSIWRRAHNDESVRRKKNMISNRWACALLFCGFVMGLLMSSDKVSLSVRRGGKNVDDVELKKETTTRQPTFSPSMTTTTMITATTKEEEVKKETTTRQPTFSPSTTTTTKATTKEEEIKPKDTSTNENNNNKKAADNDNGKNDGKKNYDDYGPSFYPKPSLMVKPDPSLSAEKESELIGKWGKWSFVDKKHNQRPKEDYCASYPNSDIPRKDFPANAWQTDQEYLKGWLDEGIRLADRAMEAILSEYGHGKEQEKEKSFEERSKMFSMDYVDYTKDPTAKIGNNSNDRGGITTEDSYKGLVRRVLHALVTNDTFSVVLGGHSAAAGHGNLFKQSYTMQFHKVVEPVFSLLGVSLTSQNLARGGLGTLQDSLGFRDSYGEDIDVMLWDSGMTEGRDVKAVDLFYRMAVLSGNRVPFLFGSTDDLRYMNVQTGADIGVLGTGFEGIPECEDAVQCERLPYAVRYMKCSTAENAQLCRANKFKANCWVDRDDVKPTTKQAAKPGSQVSWHPGFRTHQLTGRVIGFTILRAIKHALEKWQNTDNYALPDEEWHVKGHYESIRKKTLENTKDASCRNYAGVLPDRVCDVPMNSRNEYTPRANPEKTSITTIVRANENNYKPHVRNPMVYTGPDVHNPFTEIPEGEIDVLAIVSLGRNFEEDNTHRRHSQRRRTETLPITTNKTDSTNETNLRRRLPQDIIPGLGVEMSPQVAGYCDGTYNSECKRSRESNCLLSGHSDSRNGLEFNGYSGWLVMTLPSIEKGMIVMKYESWHLFKDIETTRNWKSIDNKRRHLGKIVDICDEFKFEFAIDGNITTMNKDTFEKSSVPQRTVQVTTLLDDPNYTTTPRDVELAVQMTGCSPGGRALIMTHIYFA